MNKLCTKCDLAKPLVATLWYRSTRAKSGFQTYCKACMATMSERKYYATSTRPRKIKFATDEERRARLHFTRKRWRQNNPDKMREIYRRTHFKKHYGITATDFDRLFEAQGKCCAICHIADARHERFWHLDHCHNTKIVRGILCAACNVMLGYSRDNPTILRMAAAYLEKHNAD